MQHECDRIDTMNDVGREFLSKTVAQLQGLKALAERALSQVDDEQFFRVPAANASSIATNVKHMAGNMKSRWTDFLTSDGEKPWRRRDREFVPPTKDRAGLMDDWESAWSLTIGTIAGLTPDDLLKETTIRSEADIALQRILRQLHHYSYHLGQIVTLARLYAGNTWQSLSIPLGRSAQYNASLGHLVDQDDASA